MLLEVVILCALVFYIVQRWKDSKNAYFRRRGIPCNQKFSIFGGILGHIKARDITSFDIFNGIYKMHDGPVSGLFDAWTPVILVRNVEILKQMLIKDFDHFVNHRSGFSDDPNGEVFGNTSFSMRDARWRAMRGTLTPIFTGSKLRQMFAFINQVAQNAITQLRQEVAQTGAAGLEINMEDYATRLTNDIVASAAFGLDVNSFKVSNNTFYTMGNHLTTFSTWKSLRLYMFMHMKPLLKLLRLEIHEKHVTRYFSRLVLDSMKYRKQHNLHRPDMINLLMEARGMIPAESVKSTNMNWTDTEIVGQCMGFFFAGFQTAAMLMCLAMHELMENPETQQKLYAEIVQTDGALNGGVMTYEALNKMRYLDMVISETLRKWPPNLFADRECNKDITYEVDGQRVEFKRGDHIWISTVGIQRDAKYFENPDQFDPERFSEEKKDNIATCSYMPFGAGPRSCIGNRNVLLETKAFLFYMLRDFRIEAGKKTTTPMVLSKGTFNLEPETGFWFKLITR